MDNFNSKKILINFWFQPVKDLVVTVRQSVKTILALTKLMGNL